MPNKKVQTAGWLAGIVAVGLVGGVISIALKPAETTAKQTAELVHAIPATNKSVDNNTYQIESLDENINGMVNRRETEMRQEVQSGDESIKKLLAVKIKHRENIAALDRVYEKEMRDRQWDLNKMFLNHIDTPKAGHVE